MFTLDKNIKRALIWALVTAFFALFGAVYELFSHEVYSYFMIYAFSVPLLLGVIPSLLIIQSGRKIKPVVGQLYSSGVIALTLFCVLKGVLDIYGTTNSKLPVLLLTGLAMIFLAVILGFPLFKKRKSLNESAVSSSVQ